MSNFDVPEIRRFIDARYDKKGLKSLCQDLGIDYEDLSDRTKSEMITDLIDICQRKGTLPNLVEQLERLQNRLSLDQHSSFRKPINTSSSSFSTNQTPHIANQDTLSLDSREHLRRLEKLLSEERWKDADIQTLKFLLFLADQEHEGILKERGCERLSLKSRNEILLIDQLWKSYSKDLFGFSVQKIIYEGISRDFNRFCFRVGWRKPTGRFGGVFSWKTYDELSFSTEAERGHLPFLTYKDAAVSTLASRLGMVEDNFLKHCTLKIDFPK